MAGRKLNHSYRSVIKKTETQNVPETILKLLISQYEASSGSYYTVENQNKELTLRSRIPRDKWVDENIDVFTIVKGVGLSGRALLHRRSIYERDVTSLNTNKHIKMSGNSVTELALPFFHQDSVIGVVCLGWDKVCEWSDSEIKNVEIGLKNLEIGDLLNYVHYVRRSSREQDVVRQQNKFLKQIRTNKLISVQEAYDLLVQAVGECFPVLCCSLGIYNTFDDSITMRSMFPYDKRDLLEVVKYDIKKSIHGKAIEKRDVLEVDDVQNYDLFSNKRLAKSLDLHRAYVIPIEGFQMRTGNLPEKVIIGTINIYPRGKERKLNGEILFFVKQIAESLIIQADQLEKQQITDKLRKQYLISSHINEFCLLVPELITEYIQVEGASVLILDSFSQTYRLAATTGIEGADADSIIEYSINEGITGRVLSQEEGETIICNDINEHPAFIGKWKELTEHKGKSFLGTNLHDHRKRVIGIIRCTNKVPKMKEDIVDIFSQDDKEKVEFIASVTELFVDILISEQEQANIALQAIHESRSQLWGVITKSESLINDFLKILPPDDIKIKFLEDITGHANELTRKLNVSELTSSEIVLSPERVFLWGDIIVPTVKDIKFLCEEKEFDWNRIHYGSKYDWSDVSPLWIDIERFRDVFYNLFSNAIKYAFHDPKSFQIMINHRLKSSTLDIIVQDTGRGIDEQYKESIFLRGFRAPDLESDVSGRGLGLYIARNIIRKHNGELQLTNFRYPTEFTITLNRNIENKWSSK